MTTLAPTNIPVTLTGIRASAGSGKTYSLTTEYLRAFFAGADAETILATTFTRTAAAEILGRVLRRMAEACAYPDKLNVLATDLDQPGLTAATVQAHLGRFCRSLDRVSIGTIDSFFGGIASSCRYESTMPFGGTISDDRSKAAKRLRIAALRAVLEGQDRDFVLDSIDRLNKGATGRSVVSSLDKKLAELLPLFASTDGACWDFPNLPPQLSNADLASSIESLQTLEYAGSPRSHIKCIDADRQRVVRGAWAEFVGSGLAAKLATGETSYNRRQISDDITIVYRPLIDHANAVILSDLAAKTRAIYRMLEVLAAEYDMLRAARRMSFFSDVPLALSKLIPSMDLDNLAYRLDRRLDHVMLDEFQDTDPMQWRILNPFARRVADPERGGGSVFWVGDVKQSIYGWRGANSAIFSGLETDYPNLNWKSLNNSYRSSQIVLDAVNRVFMGLEDCSVIPQELGLAASSWCDGYEQHVAEYDLPGYVAVLESPPQTDAPCEDTDAATGIDEATDIDAIIDEAGATLDEWEVAQAGAQVHIVYTAQRVKHLHAKVPGRSIGVLTRTNAMADSLLFHLRRMGVPATALAGAPLISDPAAALVLAALGVADWPGDKNAAFRVLNSPLATVVGLQHLAPWHVKDVALSIRRKLADDGYAQTLVEWAHALAPSCDARGASRLAYLVELADQFDLDPGTRPRDFIDLARDSSCMDPTPAPVQVMSIHKAKGLEFDCVVLPELHKKLFFPTPAVLTEVDPKTHEVIGVTSYANKATVALDPRLKRMYDQYRGDEMRESLSLLYVALTRARYGLTIVAPGLAEGAPQPQFSLLAIVKDRLCAGDAVDLPGHGRRLYESGDREWFRHVPVKAPAPDDVADKIQAQVSIPEAGRRIRRKQAPSAILGWDHISADQLLHSDTGDGMLTGLIIHSMLQQIEWIEDGVPGDDFLVRQAKRACPAASDSRVRREAVQFRRMLNNATVHAALTRPLVSTGDTFELWRERSFATFVDGSYVGGTFDRVVVISRAGRPVTAHLLDYKTTDLSKSTASKEAEKYTSQMATYRAALCKMLRISPEAVSVELLFPGAGESVAM